MCCIAASTGAITMRASPLRARFSASRRRATVSGRGERRSCGSVSHGGNIATAPVKARSSAPSRSASRSVGTTTSQESPARASAASTRARAGSTTVSVPFSSSVEEASSSAGEASISVSSAVSGMTNKAPNGSSGAYKQCICPGDFSLGPDDRSTVIDMAEGCRTPIRESRLALFREWVRRRIRVRRRQELPGPPPGMGPPPAGVREPRRPLPFAGAGAVALPQPDDQ